MCRERDGLVQNAILVVVAKWISWLIQMVGFMVVSAYILVAVSSETFYNMVVIW